MKRTPPAAIEAWLAANAAKMDLSCQYLGDEPNAVRKPWEQATMRWCLLASWVYEAAAGNSSIPAVYKTINDHHTRLLCDRFYLPATPRDLRLLDKAGIGAFGIEHKQQLHAFDAVGTSISYPVLSMSFVKLLTMSGIPPRRRDRIPGQHPMVMAGGLSYGAPEILAPVVDCWFLGEAEDERGNPGIGQVSLHIAALKASGRWADDRTGCYEELARDYNFLYFPQFVDVHYAYTDRTHVGIPLPSKQVAGYSANLDGMRLPLRKRHVRDLDAIPPLADPPLLYADPAMGSGDLEAGRGCPAWCSFCALTFRQKPYRQRSVDYLVDYGKAMQDNMGATRLAPFAPDFPMYTRKKQLISRLLTEVNDEVDAPAMRVDDFNADQGFVMLQVAGGMDSVTLGVEGNSQRMRDLVGKGTSDADIRQAVARGIRAGLRKFKLFMIANLPGEDEGDVVRILNLARDLADIRESMRQPTVQIQLSWTPLMIEANTPLQWFAPNPASRILGDVWEELRDLGISFKIGAKAEPNKAAFFQLAQRASRHVGEALVDAMIDADQACWGGVPRTFADTLRTRLKAWGFTNDFADCFDERDRHDLFGWEFIDQGISRDLLWSAYAHMRDFAEQTESSTYDAQFDARYHGNEWIVRCDERCMGRSCGVCNRQDLTVRAAYLQVADTDAALADLRRIDQRTHAVKIRTGITKNPRYAHVGNDHWRFAVRRAAFRAQRILDNDWGIAKRSIVFGSDEARYRDAITGRDYLEFAITRNTDDTAIAQFLKTMNTELETWLRLDAHWVRRDPRAPTLRADADLHLFTLDINDPADTILAALEHWHTTGHIDMALRISGGYFAPDHDIVNAKDYVDQIWLTHTGAQLQLRMTVRGKPGPRQIYAALIGKTVTPAVAAIPARRDDIFLKTDRRQQDALRSSCHECGLLIHINVLGQPHTDRHCPRCSDAVARTLITQEVPA